MPVDLANVNISLRQFQKISSGTYNAGEIRITGRNSLGKVNNHVSRLGQNVVPLSHEEVMAVKTAFIKALASGGVGTDEIARVRRELGLAPDTGEAVDRNLGQRSMKPLTRQQVREILDRYADTINNHPGAPRIRTAAQRNARLTDAERTDRANRRDAVNNALDGSSSRPTGPPAACSPRRSATSRSSSRRSCSRASSRARSPRSPARSTTASPPPRSPPPRPTSRPRPAPWPKAPTRRPARSPGRPTRSSPPPSAPAATTPTCAPS